MALTAVRGYYRNGYIELEEQPESIHEAEVIITFLTPSAAEAERREQLRRRFLERMEQGYPLGGRGYAHREELYAERLEPRHRG
ncbi:MAG: hypothetical protein NZM28_07810 [Fimbriimonadales bacterium]|nr:hypothetical protein [Fimbriimonadales bacterium]